MAARSRRKGRQSHSHSGRTEPAGATVPEPRVRRRDAARPAEVVHVIPTDRLDVEDLTGMSLPVDIGDSADAVRLPGDTVLTVPDGSDIPTNEELDERDARKGTRRKPTGPRPPVSDRSEPDAPAESSPPPTEPADPDRHDHDPADVDPEPADVDPDAHDHD